MNDSKWDEATRELEAKNYERARTLLQPLNNTEAQLQLAYLYQAGLGGEADIEKASEIYQYLADAGDPRGMYYLATTFLNARHLSKAVHYFEKSARLSHVSGSFWAAELHNGLYGYHRDEEKYRLFIRQAASLGHIYAIRNIAVDDMRNAKKFSARGNACVRYIAATIKGVFLGIRNPDDLHLR